MARYKIIQQGMTFFAFNEDGFIETASSVSAKECEERLRELLKDKAKSKVIKELEI